MGIFLMLLLVGAIFLFIFSIVKLVKLPKEQHEERIKYKIFLGLSIFVLLLYLAAGAFLVYIMSAIAVGGM